MAFDGKQGSVRSVCVFCGSSSGKNPVYADSARGVGDALAMRGLELVYGAGNIGLMGVLADAVLAAGGRVFGVIPQGLMVREVAHRGLTELHVVRTMHERKALMADRADAFLALPGGYGTADELFEILTWAQLGIHAKPVGLLNVEGYFDPMLGWIDHCVHEGFVRPEHRDALLISADTDELLEMVLRRDVGPKPPKWIGEEER
jgi:uncharacterized protein (TIGR00730 family)